MASTVEQVVSLHRCSINFLKLVSHTAICWFHWSRFAQYNWCSCQSRDSKGRQTDRQTDRPIDRQKQHFAANQRAPLKQSARQTPTQHWHHGGAAIWERWIPLPLSPSPGRWPVCTHTHTPLVLSGPLRLSSIAVEDAVENRGLYRVFVSRLFCRGFRHYSTTIARLSPPSGLERGSWGLPPVFGCEIGPPNRTPLSQRRSYRPWKSPANLVE